MYSGGLLVNTIAIFASISSDVVAKEDLHKFRNQINQIYWDCCCSYEECYLREDASDYNEYKEQHWILEPKYKNSRTKVIGQAIADCVTGENEFAGKKPNDIITFKDTDPVTYKQKHWNAVILYNYIHEVINGGNDSKQVDKVLKDKIEMIRLHYQEYFFERRSQLYRESCDKLLQELSAKLAQAIKYIQDYADALDLWGELAEFRDSKKKYDTNKNNIEYIAPNVNSKYSDINALCFTKYFYKLDLDQDTLTTRWQYCPAFRYAGDKLYISEIERFKYTWDQKANSGAGMWIECKDGYKYTSTRTDNIAALSKELQNSLLLDRLNGLVNEPTEDIIAQWKA